MFLLKKYTIKGESMSPTINPGNIVFASSLPYFFSKPKVNDLVTAYDPRDGRILVKRITKIDNNEYFVAGDNKTKSADSRIFGKLKRRDIIGKVIQVIRNNNIIKK